MARAAGTQADIVHVPSDLINAYDPQWGAGLLGDKAHSMVFDNSKIKRFVPDFAAAIPFSRGAEEIMAWYDADPIPPGGRRQVRSARGPHPQRLCSGLAKINRCNLLQGGRNRCLFKTASQFSSIGTTVSDQKTRIISLS